MIKTKSCDGPTPSSQVIEYNRFRTLTFTFSILTCLFSILSRSLQFYCETATKSTLSNDEIKAILSTPFETNKFQEFHHIRGIGCYIFIQYQRVA